MLYVALLEISSVTLIPPYGIVYDSNFSCLTSLNSLSTQNVKETLLKIMEEGFSPALFAICLKLRAWL